MEDSSRESPPGLYWLCWNILSLRGAKSFIRLIWVIMNNTYCIPAYFVYMMLLSPLLFLNAPIYWWIEARLFNWLLSMVACWNYTAGYNVFESGAKLEDIVDETFMFMPNHQSTADVPLCMTIFAARKRFADKVMWIMDKVFLFTNFGWVSWMHDDFFILAGKKNRDKSLVGLQRHLAQVFIPKNRRYLVLFPEGGFLRKRKAVSQAFAKKNDLRDLEYCTLPRTGALEVALKVLNSDAETANGTAAATASDAKANGSAAPVSVGGSGVVRRKLSKLVDVTIAYPDGKPLNLFSIATGWDPPCVTHVHYRVFDVAELPADPEGLKKWMYNLYYEKEDLLANFYADGFFPNGGSPPRPLEHSGSRYLALHLFFMLSSAFFWTYSAPLRSGILSLWH